jgi:hypothetical protein
MDEALPPKIQAQLENVQDLGAAVAARFIARATHLTPAQREQIADRFDQLRRAAAGDITDPLLAVLGERIALSWLQTCCEDAADAEDELQTQYSKDDRYNLRAQRSQRRLLETARTMAYVRRLMSRDPDLLDEEEEDDL